MEIPANIKQFITHPGVNKTWVAEQLYEFDQYDRSLYRKFVYMFHNKLRYGNWNEVEIERLKKIVLDFKSIL